MGQPVNNHEITRSWRRANASLILSSLLLVALSCFLYVQARFRIQPLPVGAKVRPLKLSTLQGSPLWIGAREGKKSVLLFFAVDCSHCQQALTNFRYLHDKYKDSVEILGVTESGVEKTQQLILTQRFSFPVLLDSKNQARRLYKVVRVPTVYFVDEHQILRHSEFGERSLRKDEELLKAFLSDSLDVEKQ